MNYINDMGTQSPLVSVCIITYNHEEYIAQAIESVLEQKTDFFFEIIIGEDESSDNTRKIVIDYKNRYPDKIKLVFNDRSNVIHINGRPTGRWNLIQTLAAATGKYIAVLEGDDYWTNPLKLQKQVALLEDNPEFAISGHLVQPVSAYGEPAGNMLIGETCPREFSVQHAFSTPPVHTSSLVFRNYDLTKNKGYPYLYTLPAADGLIIMMLLSYGQGYLFDEVWSAYRLHQQADWSIRPIYMRYFELFQIRYIFYKVNSDHLNAWTYAEFFALLAQSFISVGSVAIGHCNIRPIIELTSLVANQKLIHKYKLLFFICFGLLFIPVRGVLVISKWLRLHVFIIFRRIRDNFRSYFES